MAALEIEGSVWNNYIDGDVTISDCNRQVSLEFYSSLPTDEESFREDKTPEVRLEKLDLLISELQAFRNWYAESAKELLDKVPTKV